MYVICTKSHQSIKKRKPGDTDEEFPKVVIIMMDQRPESYDQATGQYRTCYETEQMAEAAVEYFVETQPTKKFYVMKLHAVAETEKSPVKITKVEG